MRDLAVLHLASSAVIDEVVEIGSTQGIVTYSTGQIAPGQITFDIAENVEPLSLKVEKDEIPLRLYAGSGNPPVGSFKHSPGTGTNGKDQLIVNSAPAYSVVIRYSTVNDFQLVEYELRGSGMRYVSDLYVGGGRVSSFMSLSDKYLRFKVLRETSAAVSLDNIRALIAMDNAPLASEVIFDLSTRSRYASGPRIVLQRFLTIMLSPEGADLYNLLPRNVHLTPAARSAILNRLSLAVTITRARMRRTTPAGAPPEETISGAALDSLDVDNLRGVVTATLKISTLNGSNVFAPLILGA